MQDNWQEFDRQMKSVLQDAAEKAPRRVWRAVSARLDSAAAAALWWRWAVPALVAAAIVAGVFVLGTRERTINGPGNVDILAESQDSGIQAGISEEALAFAEEMPADMQEPVNIQAVRHGRASAAPATVKNAVQEAREEESAPVQVTGQETEQVRETEPQSPSADSSKRSEVKDNADIAAQWARIEQEERDRRKLKLEVGGLYAQGSVGGNDSNLKYGGNGISRMAPGTGSENAGISESSTSTYGVPFTIGLGVRFKASDKLSFGTGLDYSLLTRTFNGSYSSAQAGRYEGSILHSVHYLGIPVNAYYNLFGTRDGLMNIYAWGGAEAEYCIANSYMLLASGSVIPDTAGGFQFSAGLGMGLEFKLSDSIGLYLDPSVRYYFHGNQPKSIRTDKPFMFNFDAGLRFSF